MSLSEPLNCEVCAAFFSYDIFAYDTLGHLIKVCAVISNDCEWKCEHSIVSE